MQCFESLWLVIRELLELSQKKPSKLRTYVQWGNPMDVCNKCIILCYMADMSNIIH